MELRGNLKDFSLPDIIQLVGFGRKTGVLQIACAKGKAALFFEEGQVVHAEFPGAQGEAAVFALFGVPQGEFRFQGQMVPPTRTITMDPTNLVMEAARLLDESRRDGEVSEWTVEDLGGDGEWFALEDEPPPLDPEQVKLGINELLTRRFGRGARRLLKAVDECGDSPDELLELAERVEKYVHVFLDTGVSQQVGREIRDLIAGSQPSL